MKSEGSLTPTLSNGNLTAATGGSGGWQNVGTTISVSDDTGKWYWEVSWTTMAGTYESRIGVAAEGYEFNLDTTSSGLPWLGSATGTSWSLGIDGNSYTGGSSTAYTSALSVTDVIGVALDTDNHTLTFYKNGSTLGTAYTGVSSSVLTPAFGFHTNNANTINVNFGAGSFKYTPPTGYKALNTYNLDDPTITDGTKHFDTILYTGNGTSQSITGLGFEPDLVWIKNRTTNGYEHFLWDSVRGAGGNKSINSDSTNAEGDENTAAYGYLSSFDAEGFTLTAGTTSSVTINKSSDSYVAWCWNAGSSTVSNTDGTITSSVRANTTAGFSIVNWTAEASAGTVGHGLGKIPNLILMKTLDSSVFWFVYMSDIGTGKYLKLDTGGGTNTDGTVFGTAPTSSVFSPGSGFISGNNYGDTIAYCWSEIPGFSKFGKYSGTNAATGNFIYTGFKPAYVLIKSSTDTGGNWVVLDNKRSLNPLNKYLYPDHTTSEVSTYSMANFHSNGFDILRTGGNVNQAVDDFVFFAFAESPFKYSNAR